MSAKKILIVEDDPDVLLSMHVRLRAHHYDTYSAGDAISCMAEARRVEPDLIILDLSMPVMNGLEAARELKRLLPRVPIILFTQHAEISNRLGITNLNVDRIVSKSEGNSLMGHVRSLVPAW